MASKSACLTPELGRCPYRPLWLACFAIFARKPARAVAGARPADDGVDVALRAPSALAVIGSDIDLSIALWLDE